MLLSVDDVLEQITQASLRAGRIAELPSREAMLTTSELRYVEELAILLSTRAEENGERGQSDARQDGYDEGYERGLEVGSENARNAIREEYPTLWQQMEEIDELRKRARLAKTEDEVTTELAAKHKELADLEQRIKQATQQYGQANAPAIDQALEAVS